MDHIYLDSNILIACYAGDPAEASKKLLVEHAFKAFMNLKDVQLCTSMWTLAEAYKVLLANKKLKREDVSEIETQLLHEKRLLNIKLKLVDVSPDSGYDFDEFFFSPKTSDCESSFRNWRHYSYRYHEEQWNKHNTDF
jgi:predicted nucleic acid-binding protein